MVGRRPIAVYRVEDGDARLADPDALADEFFDELHAAPPTLLPSPRGRRLALWALAGATALMAVVALIGLGLRVVVARIGSGLGGSSSSIPSDARTAKGIRPAGAPGGSRGAVLSLGGRGTPGVAHRTGGHAVAEHAGGALASSANARAPQVTSGVAGQGDRGVPRSQDGAPQFAGPTPDGRRGLTTGGRAAAAAANEFGFER
jgi:hypothetical protein